MSRCSSFPPLAADSIFRVSASNHGKGVSAGGQQPSNGVAIFKDGYLYVTPRDYRTFADVARFYTSLKMSAKRTSRYDNPSAYRRERRDRVSTGANQINSLVASNKMHNGFKNDIHSQYMQAMYQPWDKAPNKSLLDIKPGTDLTSHKNWVDMSTRNPPQVPVNYSKYNTNRAVTGERPDKYLSKYAKANGIQQVGKPFVLTGSTQYNRPDKMAALLRDWNSPSTHIDKHVLKDAVRMTVNKYQNVKMRPMSYHNVVTSRQFLKNRSHDTGFSGPGFSDKFFLATHPQFQRFAEKFRNSDLPATYKLFWKTEALKKEKAEFLPRLILGTSLEAETMERMSFQNFSNSMRHSKWSTPSKIGITNQEFGKLFTHHNFDKGWTAIAVDFSKQDRKMPREIMQARKEVLVQIAELQGLSQRAIHNIAHASDKTSTFYVVAPNGEVFLLNSGHPTGLYLGAEGNTLNHDIIQNYVDLKLGYAKALNNGKFSVPKQVNSQYGDDWLRSLPPNTSQAGRFLGQKEKYFEVVKNDLGLTTTVDLWGEKPLNHKHKEQAFLKRGFASNPFPSSKTGSVIPVYDHDRVLNKWLVPHSRVPTPQDSFDRSFGYLVLTGGHPSLYNTIHTYMDSLLIGGQVKAPKSYKEMSYKNLIHNFYTQDGVAPANIGKYISDPTFVHTSYQGGFPTAICIPSGEGKTTLERKYPHQFVDHDRFVDFKDSKVQKMHADALRTGDWNRVNAYNRSVVPINERRTLLTWSPETVPSHYLYQGSFMLDQPTNIRLNQANRDSLVNSAPKQTVFFYPDHASRDRDLMFITPDRYPRGKVDANKFLPPRQEFKHSDHKWNATAGLESFEHLPFSGRPPRQHYLYDDEINDDEYVVHPADEPTHRFVELESEAHPLVYLPPQRLKLFFHRVVSDDSVLTWFLTSSGSRIQTGVLNNIFECFPERISRSDVASLIRLKQLIVSGDVETNPGPAATSADDTIIHFNLKNYPIMSGFRLMRKYIALYIPDPKARPQFQFWQYKSLIESKASEIRSRIKRCDELTLIYASLTTSSIWNDTNRVLLTRNLKFRSKLADKVLSEKAEKARQYWKTKFFKTPSVNFVSAGFLEFDSEGGLSQPHTFSIDHEASTYVPIIPGEPCPDGYLPPIRQSVILEWDLSRDVDQFYRQCSDHNPRRITINGQAMSVDMHGAYYTMRDELCPSKHHTHWRHPSADHLCATALQRMSFSSFNSVNQNAYGLGAIVHEGPCGVFITTDELKDGCTRYSSIFQFYEFETVKQYLSPEVIERFQAVKNSSEGTFSQTYTTDLTYRLDSALLSRSYKTLNNLATMTTISRQILGLEESATVERPQFTDPSSQWSTAFTNVFLQQTSEAYLHDPDFDMNTYTKLAY